MSGLSFDMLRASGSSSGPSPSQSPIQGPTEAAQGAGMGWTQTGTGEPVTACPENQGVQGELAMDAHHHETIRSLIDELRLYRDNPPQPVEPHYSQEWVSHRLGVEMERTTRWKIAFWVATVICVALIGWSSSKVPNYPDRLVSAPVLCSSEDDVVHLVVGLTHTQDMLGLTSELLGFASSVPASAPAWSDVLPGLATQFRKRHKAFSDFPKPTTPNLQSSWSILQAQSSVLSGAMSEWSRGMPRDLESQGPIYVTRDHSLSELFFDAGKGLAVASEAILRDCLPGWLP